MKTDKRMISEFMRNHAINSPHLLPESELNYDTDWNMLMTVIAKIDKLHKEKFKYDAAKIAKGDWPDDNEYMEVLTMPVCTPIEVAYPKVFEFLNWYNSQNS